ncbi:Autophagy-related protein [Wickerhamomyces ciferrii]|uniref:Autophagy-related protein 3 n=1 Tax=Wickerhamomyces ciferrii (strain ATCC 14091 / BCRC 22168 / CBS 111 / JCM 3599 / NBRC 0793 / NRRL Y-1031 F-60-10) TaxID=1206466 RepID=K0KDU9_WICCF|nr:Autophagy-related protein [Wickerhamomyces ciferrii]CCH41106.1 Autophagy-related protein [Wickerhamomyces ciferrii]
MIRSAFNSWREYLTPAYHTSTFKQTGEITPEEFVAAGDYLTYKFPTWQWSPAPASKKRDFLPDDKQFLVTRRVPSYVRAAEYLGVNETLEEEEVDEDGWTKTTVPAAKSTTETSKVDDNKQNKEEDIEEIDDLIDENAEEDDDDDDSAAVTANNNPNKRSYDLYIHYSTAYRVPRMYLIGYDSNGTPLTPDQMFEDITADYRSKTVTIEKAPFLDDTTTVSIHPCRHAAVMKVLIGRAVQAAKRNKSQEKEKESSSEQDLVKGVGKLGLADSKDEEEWEQLDEDDVQEEDIVRVDQYLIIFLKFITSVTPGIEHDYTMDAF